MPIPSWRFTAGDTAYVRPCTPDRKVTLLKPKMHTTLSGAEFPHWLVQDQYGNESIVSQIELSSRPCSLRKDGTVKLLQVAE
jgi:hypothetical protein